MAKIEITIGRNWLGILFGIPVILVCIVALAFLGICQGILKVIGIPARKARRMPWVKPWYQIW